MSENRAVRLVCFALPAALSLCATASARKNNPPAARTGSPASSGADCSMCHDGPAGSGFVQINGAPAIYRPNEIYALVVRIEDAAQNAAGFQISAETAAGAHSGTFIITDATNTQANGSFVNHTGTGVDNADANWTTLGNAAEYQLSWQAPSANVGPITFWAAGNAVDGNGLPNNDTVYLTNTTAQFGPPIPTVSAWGLLTLVTLILCVGTIRLRQPAVSVRRRVL